METEVVGRVQNVEQRTFEPIVVPVAAYTIDGEEVIERFKFRPVMPAGAILRAFEQIQPNGVLAAGPVVQFLRESLMPEDRERFLEFLDRPELMIPAELITQVFETVTEVWSGRPTRPRSVSRSTGSTSRRTSRASASSAASLSKSSR